MKEGAAEEERSSFLLIQSKERIALEVEIAKRGDEAISERWRVNQSSWRQLIGSNLAWLQQQY